jgi:hypothetical protein
VLRDVSLAAVDTPKTHGGKEDFIGVVNLAGPVLRTVSVQGLRQPAIFFGWVWILCPQQQTQKNSPFATSGIRPSSLPPHELHLHQPLSPSAPSEPSCELPCPCERLRAPPLRRASAPHIAPAVSLPFFSLVSSSSLLFPSAASVLAAFPFRVAATRHHVREAIHQEQTGR